MRLSHSLVSGRASLDAVAEKWGSRHVRWEPRYAFAAHELADTAANRELLCHNAPDNDFSLHAVPDEAVVFQSSESEPSEEEEVEIFYDGLPAPVREVHETRRRNLSQQSSRQGDLSECLKPQLKGRRNSLDLVSVSRQRASPQPIDESRVDTSRVVRVAMDAHQSDHSKWPDFEESQRNASHQEPQQQSQQEGHYQQHQRKQLRQQHHNVQQQQQQPQLQLLQVQQQPQQQQQRYRQQPLQGCPASQSLKGDEYPYWGSSPSGTRTHLNSSPRRVPAKGVVLAQATGVRGRSPLNSPNRQADVRGRSPLHFPNRQADGTLSVSAIGLAGMKHINHSPSRDQHINMQRQKAECSGRALGLMELQKMNLNSGGSHGTTLPCKQAGSQPGVSYIQRVAEQVRQFSRNASQAEAEAPKKKPVWRSPPDEGLLPRRASLDLGSLEESKQLTNSAAPVRSGCLAGSLPGSRLKHCSSDETEKLKGKGSGPANLGQSGNSPGSSAAWGLLNNALVSDEVETGELLLRLPRAGGPLSRRGSLDLGSSSPKRHHGYGPVSSPGSPLRVVPFSPRSQSRLQHCSSDEAEQPREAKGKGDGRTDPDCKAAAAAVGKEPQGDREEPVNSQQSPLTLEDAFRKCQEDAKPVLHSVSASAAGSPPLSASPSAIKSILVLKKDGLQHVRSLGRRVRFNKRVDVLVFS